MTLAANGNSRRVVHTRYCAHIDPDIESEAEGYDAEGIWGCRNGPAVSVAEREGFRARARELVAVTPLDALDHSSRGLLKHVLAARRAAHTLRPAQRRGDGDSLAVGTHHPRINV